MSIGDASGRPDDQVPDWVRKSRERKREQEQRYSPKTGAVCSCKKGVERDNCPQCEGTGQVIDFAAIHRAREQRERKYFFSGNYGIEIEMTLAQANSASHSGVCDMDVLALSQEPDIAVQLTAIDPDTLQKELREYGAWDAEELKDHAQNLQRILWLAAGDITEQNRK